MQSSISIEIYFRGHISPLSVAIVLIEYNIAKYLSQKFHWEFSAFICVFIFTYQFLKLFFFCEI